MEKTGVLIPENKVEALKEALKNAGLTDYEIKTYEGGVTTFVIKHTLLQGKDVESVCKTIQIVRINNQTPK